MSKAINVSVAAAQAAVPGCERKCKTCEDLAAYFGLPIACPGYVPTVHTDFEWESHIDSLLLGIPQEVA